MENAKGERVEMKTMVSCINMLTKLDFITQFKAVESGLKSLATEYIYSPEDIKVVNFYRFEGDSNPSDNSILYAIETSRGEKGTLTDAYGPYSDTNVTKFMNQVEEIEKKVERNKSL